MKRILIGLSLLVGCVSWSAARAQTLTLDACRQEARDNYPAIRRYSLIEQSRDFTLSNAQKGWLPKVSATAGGFVFTDIVDVPAPMSAMTGDMKNHLLTAGVQVSQTLYDGGAIAAQRRVARAQADVQREQLNVLLYDINDRVQQLFFGILTLDEQIRQNLLLQDDLQLSRKTVESMMRGGIANQTDVDAVSVQQVTARQQEGTLRASRHAYLRMLGTFIGRELSDDTVLERPVVSGASAYGAVQQNHRPELAFYESQAHLLELQKRQFDSQLMPRLSAFGMGMYHSRMMSMLNNGMLAAGLTLNWNIGALYTRKNDKAKLDVQRQDIESQRETFLFNTRLQNENSNGIIRSLQQQIAQDDEIIRLRENIRSKSEKKVQLGTETVNEMLRDVNAVSEARQAKALHEILLLKEIYNLKNINNN